MSDKEVDPNEFAMISVVLIAQLDGPDLKVALALQSLARAKEDGWVSAYPETLAEIAGVDRSTVVRRLNLMFERGAVERRKRLGRRPGRPSYQHRLAIRPNLKPRKIKCSSMHIGSASDALPEDSLVLDSREQQGSEAKASGETSSPPPIQNQDPPPEDDPKAVVFGLGLEQLLATGGSENSARTLLGRLVRDHGAEVVAMACERMAVEQPGEPKSWLVAACKAPAQRRPPPWLAEHAFERPLHTRRASDAQKRWFAEVRGFGPQPKGVPLRPVMHPTKGWIPEIVG